LAAIKPKIDVDEVQEVEVEEDYETGEFTEEEVKNFRPKDSSIDLHMMDIPGFECEMEEYVEVVRKPVFATRVVKKKKTFNAYKELKKTFGLRNRTLSTNKDRSADKEEEICPPLSAFDPSKIKVDPVKAAMLQSRVACDLEYLGFEWRTQMEQSPDYDVNRPRTYSAGEWQVAMNDAEVINLDGELKDVVSRQSKKNTTYHSLLLVDAAGRQGVINVWSSEWETNKGLLKKGNLVRLVVRIPSNGFSTYSLWNPGWKSKNKWNGVLPVTLLRKASDLTMNTDDFEEKMQQAMGE
jgi:hypothetical protein